MTIWSSIKSLFIKEEQTSNKPLKPVAVGEIVRIETTLELGRVDLTSSDGITAYVRLPKGCGVTHAKTTDCTVVTEFISAWARENMERSM